MKIKSPSNSRSCCVSNERNYGPHPPRRHCRHGPADPAIAQEPNSVCLRNTEERRAYPPYVSLDQAAANREHSPAKAEAKDHRVPSARALVARRCCAKRENSIAPLRGGDDKPTSSNTQPPVSQLPTVPPSYLAAPNAAERSGCSRTPDAPSWRAPTKTPVTMPGSSPAANVETKTSVPASVLTPMV